MPFNPYEGIELDKLFGVEEPTIQWQFESLRTGVFFDPNGHGEALEPHPLAWESIVYRTE